MPELPDVERFKRYVDATALHKTVSGVAVHDTEVLAGVSARQLTDALRGETFERTDRHGKYLFLERSGGGALVLHFGMTGSPRYYKHREDEPEYTQVRFDFDNGYHLSYVAARKLGLVTLTDDRARFVQEKELGPDPLANGLDEDAFVERLMGRRGMIKSALMDQSLLAGLGNVYSDEILYQAEMFPRREVSELDDHDLRRLYGAMMDVIRTAVARQAKPEEYPDDYLIGHREPGAACPRCGGEVAPIDVGGRTGYYCPACQGK